MRYVFLAIFVLIASMPMQVSPCDMHESQQMSQQGSHGMDHDAMQTMDCCDHDPAVPSDNCNSIFHCGACPTGVMAIHSFVINTVFKAHSRLVLPDSTDPQSNFNPPPFKPPIV